VQAWVNAGVKVAMRVCWLSFAALALVCGSSATAHANGRFPASNAITFDPSAPSRVYLRTTFGLLVSTDDRHAWDWVCERSLGFSGPQDPTIGVFKDGSLAISLFEGLSVSHDRACGFSFVQGALDKKIFVDVSVRKTDGMTGVAISSGYANRNDDAGGPLFSSEVWVTRDGGKTWERRGAALDPTLLLETVDVSPVAPERIFISAIRGSAPDAHGVLLRSDDGGVTFTEREIPLVKKTERAPFIAGLDPKDADTLWVRVLGTVDQGARLLFTRDAGKTWKSALTTAGPMKGFALSDDGSTVFAGGPKDGVWSAARKDVESGRPFVRATLLPVSCLAYRKGELWACSTEASGFIAGVSRDSGRTWETRAHLYELRGPLACPAGSGTAELCRADWPAQRAFIGIERPAASASASADASADASVGDASANASATTAAPKRESRCACAQVGAPTCPTSRLGLFMAGLAALLVRRRR
jgi:hypothetical protein